MVVSRLAELNAQAIVLDVFLDAGLTGEIAENDRLLQNAIHEVARVPIVVLAPAMDTRLSDDGTAQLVQLDPAGRLSLTPKDLLEAVPYPWPGYPIRRYARCLRVLGTIPEQTWLPSLAQAMAQLAVKDGHTLDACRDSDVTDEAVAPRIVYTIPPMRGHEDSRSGTKDWEDLTQYREIFTRCLATNLWNERSSCSDARMFSNRIAVVGASHPQRRDRHYTPLGDMSGPEIAVNAARSLVLFPSNGDSSWLGKLSKKLAILISVSVVVWLPYYLVRCLLRRKGTFSGAGGIAQAMSRLTELMIFVIAVLVALAASAILAAKLSITPDADILVPVLAVALEVLIDKANNLVHSVERVCNEAFRLARQIR